MADELARGDAQACDALVTAATEDQSAPFAPDVVRDLAALKRADHFRFETLRVRLKRAGCRVGALDSLIAAASGDRGDGRQPSQADNMVGLAEAADLFQTPDEIAYADIDVDGHRETWPVKSSGLRRWLKRLYFEEFAGAPNNEAVAAALGVIEAKAQHDTPVREVFIRVGGLDGKIYLDLGDPEWRAVEVDKAGWRIIDRPLVRFRRAPDMRPLPIPDRNGSIKGLRPLLNIPEDEKAKPGEAQGQAGDDDFILAVAFALACLRPRGPYPVEAIGGEQGTAKSTRSAMLRMLIDPRHPKLRALPRNERDLMVTARNQHVLAFDNVSGLPMWLSDALCRLSSGPATAPANSTPTMKKRCSPAPGRSLSTASRRWSSGPISPNDRPSPPASRSTPRPGSQRKRSGRPSTKRMRRFLAPYWMRWRRGSSASRRPARPTCRAWPTSPIG